MISGVIYSKIEKETKILQEEIKNEAAYSGDETWDIQTFMNTAKFAERLTQEELMEFACVDVTEARGVAQAKNVRSRFFSSKIMLMADASISPMTYIKPGIQASSLLLRPYTLQEAQAVIKEFVRLIADSHEASNEADAFIIDSKDGKIHVPYNKIYFFEAREKKIFLQTLTREYAFYETLDVIEGRLPSQFKRCHRSFIVNVRKIDKVQLSKNIILLTQDRDVPLSRSYKEVFKKMGNG